MSFKPEDILADDVNELVVQGVTARKGTVAAALANANIIASMHTEEAEKAEARQAIKKLTPALVALELHKHLAWKNPEIQKIIDEFLVLNSLPIE
jgi:hypothetical protein